MMCGVFAMGLIGAAATCAMGSFHLMQIEQVMLGWNGDPTAQAVQLRMRSAFQNQVTSGRLVVRDAAGLNPIVVRDFTTNVAVSTNGSRILIASANFLNKTTPGMTADFSMANTVPASYIAAGRLTFEQDNGTILWSLSWGGSAYTGSQTGATTNDADGNFGPAVAGAFPISATSALRFTGTGTAISTNNLAQYATVTSGITFVNNAGVNFVVNAPPPVDPCFADYNLDGGVDGQDVDAFFTDWAQGDAAADTNLDGGVDGADVEQLFIEWSAGGC